MSIRGMKQAIDVFRIIRDESRRLIKNKKMHPDAKEFILMVRKHSTFAMRDLHREIGMDRERWEIKRMKRNGLIEEHKHD